jgi:hypothetical protein
MPTPTYTPLATVTLGSTATSVTFSSIPATYRDLILVVIGKSGTGTEVNLALRPNNDSGNASRVFMFGDGSSTASGAFTDALFVGTLPTSGSNNTTSITNIMDYSATDKHKTMLQRSNTTASFVSAQALRWGSTSAITSIVLLVATQSIGAGTTLNLYGIVS